MERKNIREFLPYTGLPVMLCALWIVKGAGMAPIALLLRATLLVFVYLASLSDLSEQRIPNRLIGIMLGLWILLIIPQLFLQTETALRLILSGLAGGVIGGLIFLIVYLISRKGLGGGDVKLMAVSGLYLGFNAVLPSILYGSILLEIVAVTLVLLKKIGRKDAIPLAPFLLAGMVLTTLVQ